jgi:putative nucleotidyltransferase with HDIG domain
MDTRAYGAHGAGPENLIDRLGPLFIHYLFSAARTVQIHSLGNDAAVTAVSRLAESLLELGEVEGRVAVILSTDLLSINDVRIVVDPQSMGPVLFLIEEMKKRKVEEIDFPPDPGTDELGAFLKEFFADTSEEDVFGDLSARLAEAGVREIRLTEWIERVKYLRDAKVNKKEIREESNRAMARAVMFMGEVVRAIEQSRPVQVPKANRITQQMADIIRTDETILVGLASIKEYDEYTFAHSVNVSVLSMLIADRLGLRKSDVAQVGVAALFHDIGKTHIPQEVLNKPANLDAGEWHMMERHPMLGAIELSRVRSLRSVADQLLVALQHHVQFDSKGYPRKPGEWKIHPFVKIVSVADVYDAMTTPRIYRENVLRPDSALRFIARGSGGLFDPLVVKVFVRAMGIYPVGTVVRLDSREYAVVTRQNEQCSLMHRPVVAVLDPEGRAGEQVDLAERGPNGAYKRSILDSVRDAQYEVKKADYFVMK